MTARLRLRSSLFLLLLLLLGSPIFTPALQAAPAQSWWNKDWTLRKKITIDTSAKGAPIAEPIGSAVVLVRLHEGDFQFPSAREDGSDLRFVATDDKTLLPYHVEKFDSLMSEAFVWVKVPEFKPGETISFWLYYGNAGESVTRADDAKATYDADTVLVYHFAESGVPPVDSSAGGNTAEAAGLPVPGALIAGGLRLSGQNAVSIPAKPSLTWTAGGTLTWSAWIKPVSLAPNAVLFSRREADQLFLIGLDNGSPYLEITGQQRTPAGAPIAENTWHHLAVTATNGQFAIYLDGTQYGTLAGALPALNSPLILGKDPADTAATGFKGEIDELQIAKAARPLGALKLAALNQGTNEAAAKLLVLGNDEQSAHGEEGEITKHLTLIADISKSLTFDGWAVIFLCTLLAIVGWIVTALKLIYLSKIKKATDAFLKQWEHLSADLSVLDHGDEQSIKSMGGKASTKLQKLLRQSPLYHIYQIGFSEIQHRAANARAGFKGLSGRSMQAIRATLDGGLVREVQRLNSQLVFLTIGIAGGPYLGLLGTVIGVMITFAVIAKSGAVEVNSIAPGIAGALLATVAGLAVAIPALFAYSYISSRIKDAVSEMQIFIDEFVAKIAEAYPSSND